MMYRINLRVVAPGEPVVAEMYFQSCLMFDLSYFKGFSLNPWENLEDLRTQPLNHFKSVIADYIEFTYPQGVNS